MIITESSITITRDDIRQWRQEVAALNVQLIQLRAAAQILQYKIDHAEDFTEAVETLGSWEDDAELSIGESI